MKATSSNYFMLRSLACRKKSLPHGVAIVEQPGEAVGVLELLSVGVVHGEIQQQGHVEGGRLDDESLQIHGIDLYLWVLRLEHCQTQSHQHYRNHHNRCHDQ